MTLSVAMLLSGLATAQPATGQTGLLQRDLPVHRCAPVIEREIGRVGLPQTRIDRIQISRQEQDIRDNRRTVGFDAWVRLSDCPGSMVVDMDRSCRVRQVYARGMCEVPGLKSFD